MIIRENFNLKEISYFKIGGIANKFIEVENLLEIVEILNKNEKVHIVGNTTNILFGDDIIKTPIISLKNLDRIKYLGNNEIEVEAGCKFAKVIEFMRDHDFSGPEKLAGIPGTIGGMVIMNAGAYGDEIFNYIKEVQFIREAKIQTKEAKEIFYEYRNSEFKKNKDIITKVKLKLRKGYKREEIYRIMVARKEKQPLEYPNIGSIFKNPEGDFAGRIIQDIGLKGYRIGDAQISEKHSNFIINLGEAKAEEVGTIIEIVKSRVLEEYKINLKEEIIKIFE